MQRFMKARTRRGFPASGIFLENTHVSLSPSLPGEPRGARRADRVPVPVRARRGRLHESAGQPLPVRASRPSKRASPLGLPLLEFSDSEKASRRAQVRRLLPVRRAVLPAQLDALRAGGPEGPVPQQPRPPRRLPSVRARRRGRARRPVHSVLLSRCGPGPTARAQQRPGARWSYNTRRGARARLSARTPAARLRLQRLVTEAQAAPPSPALAPDPPPASASRIVASVRSHSQRPSVSLSACGSGACAPFARANPRRARERQRARDDDDRHTHTRDRARARRDKI